MRIDLNTRATRAPKPGGPPSGPRRRGKRRRRSPVSGKNTAQFLFDRVKTQALTPDSAQIEAGNLRIDALRKVLADGSYNVPPEVIAGAIVRRRGCKGSTHPNRPGQWRNDLRGRIT